MQGQKGSGGSIEEVKKEGKTSSTSLSPTEQAELWRLEFFVAELGKQVTMVDTAKNHYTSLALVGVVMLPNDVANLSTEGS